MGLPPGGNLANPRHISYHLLWKLGHVPNYFVNIQGAVREPPLRVDFHGKVSDYFFNQLLYSYYQENEADAKDSAGNQRLPAGSATPV